MFDPKQNYVFFGWPMKKINCVPVLVQALLPTVPPQLLLRAALPIVLSLLAEGFIRRREFGHLL